MRGTPDTLPLPPKHQTFPGLNISPPPLRFNHMLLHIPPTHPLYPYPLPFQRPPPDPTCIPYGPTLTDYIDTAPSTLKSFQLIEPPSRTSEITRSVPWRRMTRMMAVVTVVERDFRQREHDYRGSRHGSRIESSARLSAYYDQLGRGLNDKCLGAVASAESRKRGRRL